MFAGLNAVWPTDDEGDACAGFVGTVLASAIVLHGGVSVEQFEGLVVVAIVDDRAVVATEYEDGVVSQVQTVQRVHDLAYCPVELQDDVAARAEAALAGKAWVSHAGHMHVLCTQVEEEGFVLVLGYEVLGVVGDDVGYVFIVPQGRLATCHPADARNAVDDGIVVSLAGFHLHQFGILFARRPVAHLVVVADGDGVVGVEVDYSSVFHEDAGNAVYCSRNDEFVVKSYILCIGLDERVEVCTALGAETQVPLADDTGGVAFSLEHVGHGDASSIYNQFGVARSNAGVFLSPGIHTCKQAEA